MTWEKAYTLVENSVLVLIQGKPLNAWIIPGFSMGADVEGWVVSTWKA